MVRAGAFLPSAQGMPATLWASPPADAARSVRLTGLFHQARFIVESKTSGERRTHPGPWVSAELINYRAQILPYTCRAAPRGPEP